MGNVGLKVSEKGRKILIINLTRMGDLLQMTPFLGGFRHEHPDVKIILLVLKQFEEICSGFPFVDQVVAFDASDFLSRLGDPNRSLVENHRTLKRMVERLKETEFDTVINLSFSNLSAYLTSLLRARDVRGITIDEYGNRLIKHRWINHFYNIVNDREINLFNYVDFIRRIGGSTRKCRMSFSISESARTFAKTFFRTREVSETDWVIGIQPGASEETKRWPAVSFGALAAEVIKEGAKVLVFGSPAERELGQRVGEAASLSPDQMKRQFLNMTGETSLDQLAALLERCNLLVTNDTGTMHMATAVGTRVIELSLGPVYFPETGPYGEGHLVIQTEMACAPCGFFVRCRNPKCKESISVAHVLQVIRMVREGRIEPYRQLEDGSAWAGIQLYRGVFDEDGMLEFLPMIRRPLTKIDLVRHAYREMWKIVLDETNREIDPVLLGGKIGGLFAMNGAPVNLEDDCMAFETLAALAREGIEISKRLVEWSENIAGNVSAIKTTGQMIHDIDERIAIKGLTHRPCHPLTFMFQQGKENLEEGDVGILSQKTLRLYETLFREATLMSRGLRTTLAYLEGTS